MLLDGALGEHIRLALQIAVLVQFFQRTEQIVGAVVGERQGVAAGVDKPVFLCEGVIQRVQLRLLLSYGDRIGFPHLQINEPMNAVSQLNEALDALLRGVIELRLYHHGVFTEIHLAIHNGVAVILHVGICRDRLLNVLLLTEIGQGGGLIGTADLLHGFVKLRGKVGSLYGSNGKVLPSVLRAFRCGNAEYHFRMIDKIAVDGKAVLVFSEMHPVRLNVDRPVPLLQKDDVRDHIRAGIGLERIVWQTDRPQQLRALGDVFTHIGCLLVHGIAGGHKGDDAARPHLIQRLCEEVVVNGKTELVVSPVVDLIIAEWNVAYGKIIEIPPIRGLKARHRDVRFGI